jgi:hypothetical protein
LCLFQLSRGRSCPQFVGNVGPFARAWISATGRAPWSILVDQRSAPDTFNRCHGSLPPQICLSERRKVVRSPWAGKAERNRARLVLLLGCPPCLYATPGGASLIHVLGLLSDIQRATLVLDQSGPTRLHMIEAHVGRESGVQTLAERRLHCSRVRSLAQSLANPYLLAVRRMKERQLLAIAPTQPSEDLLIVLRHPLPLARLL